MDKTIKAIIDSIEEKKGENIVVLDMRKLDGAVCDYYVICEAQSTMQVDAMAGEVEHRVETKLHERPLRVQGRENGLWIIIDYGNIMVHLFERETRAYYALEKLWSDAPATRFSE